jgi:prepilin peptidase CpaA
MALASEGVVVMSTAFQTCLVSLLPILAVTAALKDLTSYTIPNWICLALAGGFALLAVTAGLPLQAIGIHAAVGLVALLAGMVMFGLGWIGGGDAKLLAACSLWFGWPGGREFLLDTALAGGVFAIALLMVRGQTVRPFLPLMSGWAGRLTTPGEPAPYGVAIALGALIAFPSSEWLPFVHTGY